MENHDSINNNSYNSSSNKSKNSDIDKDNNNNNGSINNNNNNKVNKNIDNSNHYINNNSNNNNNINKYKFKNNCKIKIFYGIWNKSDVKSQKDHLYVYGDNDMKMGCKGQAVIRILSNTHGIPTKKKPSRHKNSYYNDDEFELNKLKIDSALNQLIEKSAQYQYVVFPQNSFGTGLSELDTRAPKTFKYLSNEINNIIINNK